MLNWIPALFLLLMHGAAAPEGGARDARLPLGAVAVVQAAQARAQGPGLAATLRMIARYAALVETAPEQPLVAEPPQVASTLESVDQVLPEDVFFPSSRTRDGPSVV